MSEENEQPEKQPPVTPLDLMICRFQMWVEKLEKRQAEERARRAIPDDVPSYVTRYP